MRGTFTLLLNILIHAVSRSYSLGPLNEFIRSYEPLDYTLKSRSKRSTRPQKLSFTAYGRRVEMELQPDPVTFTSATRVIDDSGRRLNVDHRVFVEGKLRGERGSNVQGVWLDNGLFSGTFHSPKHGLHFIEPAQRYFPRSKEFHSIIYRAEDIGDMKRYQYLIPAKINQESRSRKQHRKTRSSSNYEKNICPLSLEADYRFLTMTGGITAALHTMINHVHALNIIYNSNFNTSELYAPYGLRFNIGMVKIYNETETWELLGPIYSDAATFLGRLADRPLLRKYCEAIFFTYTRFTGGIVGQAYRGKACTGNYKKRNVALVSFRLDNMKLPTAVTQIVLAHEVGHSFGAWHDTDECEPGGRNNGYIMNANDVDGMKDNNYRFSPCSKRDMGTTIGDLRADCLLTKKQLKARRPPCGNSMVDEGEECDCGNEYSCKDMEPGNCCDYKTCKLNKHANCSASNGMCCDAQTCKPKEAGESCLAEGQCKKASFCRGNTSNCDEQKYKENFITECYENTRVCYNGSCLASICTKYGLEGCYCETGEDQCKICCMYDGECQVAKTIPKLKSKVKTYQLTGSLCNAGKGYCDFFHDCLVIDTAGPLKTFIQFYFTRKGIKEVTHRFWWAILLGTIAWICCIVLLIKCGATYTKSSNPLINEKQPARKITIRLSKRKSGTEEETMVPMDEIRTRDND